MGTPGKVAPPSTTKTLPVTYLEESWIKYRTIDVMPGSVVPRYLIGRVL